MSLLLIIGKSAIDIIGLSSIILIFISWIDSILYCKFEAVITNE